MVEEEETGGERRLVGVRGFMAVEDAVQPVVFFVLYQGGKAAVLLPLELLLGCHTTKMMLYSGDAVWRDLQIMMCEER